MHCVLSEMPVKKGSVGVRGRLSYATQESWVFSGTVRENILFGERYNDAR